jgi:hypothetical protein
MAHLGFQEDEQGDLVGLVYYCSDFCNREHNPDYGGWNGAHELDTREVCAACGVEVDAVEELDMQWSEGRPQLVVSREIS